MSKNATKIVNIDDLAQASKAIVIDGETHDMREITVQEFINKAAEARKVEAEAGDLTMEQQVDKAIEMVHDAFPTVDRERLARLKLTQLSAIIDLIVTAPEQIEAEVKTTVGNA